MNAAPVILLVEPSPILRLRLQEWLENLLTDSCILIAANGLDALWRAAQEQPSHILIEMHLPDITGSGIIATGSHESGFILDSVQSAGEDGFVLNHNLYDELLPLWGYL